MAPADPDARLSRQAVPKLYGLIAPVYDLHAIVVEQRARRRGLELLKVRNGERILDIGVGTGLFFATLVHANPNGRTEGIDVTPAMLRRAARRLSRVAPPGADYRLTLGDAYALDYGDDTFDAVTSTYMIDVLPADGIRTAVGEMHRVLKPGGRLLLLGLGHGTRLVHRAWGLISRIPYVLGGCRPVHLLPYLESAGFKQIHVEIVSQRTFPSEVVYAEKSRIMKP